MPYASFDIETSLARRAEFAPAIACGSWTTMNDAGEISPGHIGLKAAALSQFETLLASGGYIVNQFLAFDLACIMEAAPHLIRPTFEALRAGRFIGVDVCQQLIDVAHGRLDVREPKGYSLTNIARWNGIDLEDKEATWRLYYSQLADIAPDLWPADARKYVLDDADLPLRIYKNQAVENQRFFENYRYPILHDAAAQTWSQVSLYLTSAHGVRTNRHRVEALRAKTHAEIEMLKVKLQAAGLVRTDGTRDTKKAKAAVKAAFEALGKPVPMTTEQKNRKAKSAFVPQVSTEEDTMILSGQQILIDYADYSSANSLMSRVEDLAEGYELPLNCEFTSIRGTGRTSSRKPRAPHKGKQMQNDGRGSGVRECHEPRAGMAFLWADFEAAEMHTLAQNCRDEVGYSKLGELLNADIDPHAWFAGVARLGLIGTDKDIADAVMAREDKKELRGWAKPSNFGKPGGMGNEKFRIFSRKQYGVLFTEAEAEYYSKLWFRVFPEVKDLHKVVKRLLGRNETCTVRIKRGGFVAGGKRFTAACNFFFQAPCAAGAKAALNHILFECYADPDSPLYGFRCWNFVHDEICLEGPIERVHAAGVRLREIMEREFNRYCPDYTTDVEVIAGDTWSKEAKPKFDAQGRLTLWRYEDYLREKAEKEARKKELRVA